MILKRSFSFSEIKEREVVDFFRAQESWGRVGRMRLKNLSRRLWVREEGEGLERSRKFERKNWIKRFTNLRPSEDWLRSKRQSSCMSKSEDKKVCLVLARLASF